MSLRLRNINSLNVKQENEIMAKAVAGVKNINIGKPTNKAKNITFERKATVIAGKSLKGNVVQRTALGELSNKILSREEDSTSTTNIVKKEVVKTRSLAVAAINNTRRKCDVSSHKNSMRQYGPYTTAFRSELQTKPKCNKRKLSSRRTQENVKLKKSVTILNVKNEKVEKANKTIKDVNKIVPISRSLNKVENREVEKPEPKSYSSQRLEGNLRDIDKQSGDCHILLGYYAEDIYSYLRDLEIKSPISPTFMSELQINSKMRSILVNWLVEVHQQFALLPETLYVTISILDRFLQALLFQVEKAVQRKYLQLVGISAMFVACKYEEMCSPDVQDFVYISDNAYSKEQILKMEQHILMKLEFKLGRPVPLHFLRRFSRAADASSEQHAMAKYLMELCLIEYDMCHYAPSMIAAAALYLSLSIINNPCMKPVWTKSIQHYSRYNVGEVKPVAKKLAAVVKKLDNSKFEAVKKKYSHSKYAKMSLRPELDSQALKSLTESRFENVVP